MKSKPGAGGAAGLGGMPRVLIDQLAGWTNGPGVQTEVWRPEPLAGKGGNSCKVRAEQVGLGDRGLLQGAAPLTPVGSTDSICQVFKRSHKSRCFYEVAPYSNVGNLFKDTVNTAGPNKTDTRFRCDTWATCLQPRTRWQQVPFTKCWLWPVECWDHVIWINPNDAMVGQIGSSSCPNQGNWGPERADSYPRPHSSQQWYDDWNLDHLGPNPVTGHGTGLCHFHHPHKTLNKTPFYTRGKKKPEREGV